MDEYERFVGDIEGGHKDAVDGLVDEQGRRATALGWGLHDLCKTSLSHVYLKDI